MNLKQFIARLAAGFPGADALLNMRRALVALRAERPSFTASVTSSQIQSALTAAESGEPLQLFTLYRDMILSHAHIQGELNKRKLAVIGQPWSVLPWDKENPDDVLAAAACDWMLGNVERLNDSLAYLLNATILPVVVAEKIYRPVRPDEDTGDVKLRFTLRELHPVPFDLLCFREPYGSQYIAAASDPEAFEPAIRLYPINEQGFPVRSFDQAYALNPDQHLVHRGHLATDARDTRGGPARALLFWWLFSELGRDWFARAMERFGSPFPVGYTDTSDPLGVDLLKEAFSLATKIGGLVVPETARVELKEINSTGLAEAHIRFIELCNREISKLIVGQTLSAEAQPTGLGSGVARLHAQVRDDIRLFDQQRLGETLRHQVFAQFLRINGLPGRAPRIVWGGLDPEEATRFADALGKLRQAGLRPTDEAIIDVISERIGFDIERVDPAPQPDGASNLPPGLFIGARAGQPRTQPPQASRLAEQIAAELRIPPRWLNPIRDALDEIEKMARRRDVPDAELLTLLDRAAQRLPEVFERMDKEALQHTFEAALGGVVLNTVAEKIDRSRGS
jgi:hypothetical protein